MKKKGVEMSLNVIIIAAIGLLILVILAFLLVNYLGKTNAGLQSCTVQGGKCQQGLCTVSADSIPNTDCKSPTSVCCKIVSTSTG